MHRMMAPAALALLVLAPVSNASAQLLAAKDGPIVQTEGLDKVQ